MDMKMFIVLIASLLATSLCQIKTLVVQNKYKDWKAKFGVKSSTPQEEVLIQLNFQKSNDIV
jgi:hypothetical protein